MTYTAEYIKNKLIEKLNAVHVEVIDESDGCGSKFSVLVVADCFKDKTSLNRHRLVNSTLAEELKTIHAFSLKACTPDQWKGESQ